MPRYRVWIGSWSFDTRAKDAADAKRKAANSFKVSKKAWDRTITSIMKGASVKKVD